MKTGRNLIIRFSLATALLLGSTAIARAQTVAPSVIVQVQPGFSITTLAAQFGFTVIRSVNSNTGAPTYVVSGGDPNALKLALAATSAVKWAANNVALTVAPLDGGETVLPLDGGETVLPLDGGETVLPLGPGIQTVDAATVQSALNPVLQIVNGQSVLPLDGGETVLPLSGIQAAYQTVAGLDVGSPGLILQRAFGKIGYFGAVLHSTGKGVTIADLDTGADTCHPALSGIFTYNFVPTEPVAPENCPSSATVPGPGYGHGTEVASLLRVLAPAANIWAVRVFDSTGTADVATVYEAAVWAVNHGAQIINMSFGATTNSAALNDAIAYAAAHNVLVAAAAGNSNLNSLMYPAAIYPAIGTVATDLQDLKTSFSNYGSAAGVSAPGSQLAAAYPGDRYAIVWGTSFATPLVAAEGALTFSAWASVNSVTMPAIFTRSVIQGSADNIDAQNLQYAGQLGTGRINMWKAYRLIAPATTP